MSEPSLSPKFSVAIPVYNRSGYLKSAISFCLSQTVSDLEVIVSDDCSSEDLESVVRSFGDPRIRYFRSEDRLGATRNHQRSVELSRGKYVVNLNSDDLLLPNCLEVAGAALDKCPEAAAAYFACVYLKEDKVEGASLVPALYFANSTSLGEHPWLEKFHGTGPSCCLFRKESFDRLSGYRTKLRLAYDWNIYMRFLTIGGGVIFIPHALAIYRFHEEQMMQTTRIDGLWDMLDLWPLKENAHWPASEIAGLVLAQWIGDLRRGKGFTAVFAVLKEVRRRGLMLRIISGLPGAFYEKLRCRIYGNVSDDLSHYIEPQNRDAALENARALVRAYGSA